MEYLLSQKKVNPKLYNKYIMMLHDLTEVDFLPNFPNVISFEIIFIR
jgi:hypothetical protein